MHGHTIKFFSYYFFEKRLYSFVMQEFQYFKIFPGKGIAV